MTIDFGFYARPVAVEGDGRVERLIVERTRPGEGHAIGGTGETYAIPCGLIVGCIGYRTPPIPGVPYDDEAGRFANEDGRVMPGLYAVGWARRGPTARSAATGPMATASPIRSRRISPGTAARPAATGWMRCSRHRCRRLPRLAEDRRGRGHARATARRARSSSTSPTCSPRARAEGEGPGRRLPCR